MTTDKNAWKQLRSWLRSGSLSRSMSNPELWVFIATRTDRAERFEHVSRTLGLSIVSSRTQAGRTKGGKLTNVRLFSVRLPVAVEQALTNAKPEPEPEVEAEPKRGA